MSGVATAALEWRSVTLRLGAFSVQDVSLRLEEGGWLGIVGATGAGKTILLEIAAGFLTPSFGSILREGVDVTSCPPEERRIGYVPQDDLLFPHLDVTKNLLFRAGKKEPQQKKHFAEIVSGLGISHLLDRSVATVSGGEAQRIAIGRALLANAQLLLLDECTSALDEETRERIGYFLSGQQRARNLSIVQVTHDRAEAHRLADQVIEMDAGRIVGPILEPPGDANTSELRRLSPREIR